MKKMIKSFLVVMCLASLAISLSVGLTGCKVTEDAGIKVYTRDTTSGTRDGFFTNIDFEEAKTDNSALVAGYVEVDSNGSMINAISHDEFGIGYISLASLSDSGLIGLTYEGVIPSEANVLNGTYQLTRNFNYITRSDFSTTQEEAIVEAYLAFLTTKDAKATIQSKDGIIAIDSLDPTWDSIKDQYPICQEDNSSLTIKFGGSTSVEKIAKALSSEFSSKCGNFKVEHNHTGSGDAYKRTQGSEKAGANFLHIAFLSRELKETEAAVPLTSGSICIDAIVAVVNSKNELTSITTDVLKKIYNGTITKWSEVE